MHYAIQVPSQLSSHLRALRKAKGLSQADLGARLGLSQTRIARIESDPLSISVAQLLQVLSILGVRVALDVMPTSAPQAAAYPAGPESAHRVSEAAATTLGTPDANNEAW